MRLVHFTAEWCPPCKMMKPIIKDVVSENGDIEYVMIDIDESPDLAKAANVMGVPTFILEKDGTEVSRITGAMPKNDFIQKLGI